MHIDLRKVASFRIAFGAFLGAVILAAVLSAIWDPLAYVFFPAFAVL